MFASLLVFSSPLINSVSSFLDQRLFSIPSWVNATLEDLKSWSTFWEDSYTSSCKVEFWTSDRIIWQIFVPQICWNICLVECININIYCLNRITSLSVRLVESFLGLLVKQSISYCWVSIKLCAQYDSLGYKFLISVFKARLRETVL